MRKLKIGLLLRVFIGATAFLVLMVLLAKRDERLPQARKTMPMPSGSSAPDPRNDSTVFRTFAGASTFVHVVTYEDHLRKCARTEFLCRGTISLEQIRMVDPETGDWWIKEPRCPGETDRIMEQPHILIWYLSKAAVKMDEGGAVSLDIGNARVESTRNAEDVLEDIDELEPCTDTVTPL